MDLRIKALELAKGLEPVASNIERVSAETNPEAASWAFTQWRLRERALKKFAKAEEMLFTAESLEQSTHEKVAAYHASRFPADVLVADMTCGIGGDLLALCGRGPAVGLEIDPDRARYARHNLKVNGRECQVLEQDSLAFVQDPANRVFYAYADPARRVGGRRTLDMDQFEPSPVELASILNKMELGCIKLSPMLSDPLLVSLGSSFEFISYGGECREALVWLGKTAEPGRWAVHVESGSRLPASETPADVEEPERYIFEADPAAIRAHCLGALCEEHDLAPLGDSNGYLTGNAKVASPWLKGYRVVSTCPANQRTVRATLGQLDCWINVVKSRMSGVEPEVLKKQLRTKGHKPVTLIVYGVGKSHRYALVTPVGR